MNRIIGYTSFTLYALLITYLSLAPKPGMPPVGNDKVAHALAYLGFAVLAAGLGLSRRHYLVACCCIIAYSGLMEVGQSFIPGREMSVLDMAANTLGVVLGALVIRFMPRQAAGLKPD
jgi:VanZ family protein